MRNDVHSAAAISLKRVAELWLLMMRRRWQYESSVLVSAIVFAGFLVLLGRTAHTSDPAMLTPLFLVAVGNAVNVTLTAGGESLAAALRFQLLPLSRRMRFASRLLFGTPLRVPAFLLVWIWSAVMISGRGAIELLQATLLIVAAAMLSVIWSEPVSRRWLRPMRGAFVAVTLALTIGALVPSLPSLHAQFALTDRVPAAVRDLLLALEVGGRAPLLWELLAAALYGALAVMLGVAAYGTSAAPPARPSAGRVHTSRLSRAARVLAPPLRKEMLLLLRMAGLCPAIVLTLGVCLLSFGVGVPWLLAGIPLFWFGFHVNALGADLPQGGMTRYRLLAMSLRRVLAWRQIAVLLLAAASALVSAAIVAVSVGIARPVNGDSRWAYPAVLAYAMATLLISAIPANRVAVRYPLPRKRRAWIPAGETRGPAALMVWTLIAVFVTVVAVVAAFAVSEMVTRGVAPQVSSTPVTAVIAATIIAALYGIAILRGWQVPAGDWEGSHV